ncbi:hypothetical protein [Halovenus marina]|uniref:hypothetical protein n=1 Tax=Halovenus marina TaxID=3396621 RepID=UPI003F5763AE
MSGTNDTDRRSQGWAVGNGADSSRQTQSPDQPADVTGTEHSIPTTERTSTKR